MEEFNYTDMLTKLQELILGMPPGEEKNKLKQQRQELSDIIKKLVEKNVRKDTAKYNQITAQLENANASIQDAIKDIKKIGETINTIASVITSVREALK